MILDVNDDEFELESEIARVLGELTAERAAKVYAVVLHGSEHAKPLVTWLLQPFIDGRQLSNHLVAIVDSVYGISVSYTVGYQQISSQSCNYDGHRTVAHQISRVIKQAILLCPLK